MPSRARLDWRGDELVAKVRRAVEDSIDETVDAGRDDATETHPWHVDPRFRRFRNIKRPINPHLEDQIESEHVTPGSAVPTGRFGYTRRRGFYGLFLEFKFPTIRPAGDRVFPTLPARIRRRLSL
jgi:hypothetical protein